MHHSAHKILIVSSEFPPNTGGIGNHAYNLALALSNEGYDIQVLADVNNANKKALSDTIECVSFRIHFIERNNFIFITYLQRILSALRLSSKQDTIICSGKFSLWLGILFRFFNRKKNLIAIVHGSELDLKNRYAKKFTSFSLSRFNKIVAVSEYTKKFLPTTLSDRIQRHVIHNGINLDEFQHGINQKLSGYPALVTVGSVTERKGQKNVVNALPIIQQQFPEVKYHVIGKPVIETELFQLAKNLKVDNAIKLYGAVDRKELLQKLSGASIKLMLSNHTAQGDFEGFGIAVLEANAYGIPAIGSKDSGIADAIVDEATGLLVNQTNAEDVSAAVKKILDNYTFFSDNAKKWAQDHHWKNIVQQYKVVING